MMTPERIAAMAPIALTYPGSDVVNVRMQTEHLYAVEQDLAGRGVATAKKITAHARYVDEDVQRVDLKVTSDAGETATIDLSLDQTRQPVIDLTNAYSACRPALLDQKQVDRITSFFGMR